MTTHAHPHQHGAPDAASAFAIGVAINGAIVVVEIVYGLIVGSMALLADAGHNLGDVLGLVIGLGAARLARRRPTERHTYGFRRATVLSALANALLLLVATGAIGWESIRRLHAPEAVSALPVIVVASIAFVANGASALFFLRDRKRDMNVRAAFVHLAGDAAISIGVVVAGVVMLRTGWTWLDPLVGLAIAASILATTWSLLRQSFNLALDAVPQEIDLAKVRAYLLEQSGVTEVHDLHVWAMSTTETALTAHLVLCEGGAVTATFFAEVSKALHDDFGIGHATLQVEHAPREAPCCLAPDDVV